MEKEDPHHCSDKQALPRQNQHDTKRQSKGGTTLEMNYNIACLVAFWVQFTHISRTIVTLSSRTCPDRLLVVAAVGVGLSVRERSWSRGGAARENGICSWLNRVTRCTVRRRSDPVPSTHRPTLPEECVQHPSSPTADRKAGAQGVADFATRRLSSGPSRRIPTET